MSKHTKGKVDLAWEPGKHGVIGTVGEAAGKLLAVVLNDGGPREAERKANAQRFTDCWNACAGLDMSDVPSGGVMELVKKARRMAAYFKDLADSGDCGNWRAENNKFYSSLIKALAPFTVEAREE